MEYSNKTNNGFSSPERDDKLLLPPDLRGHLLEGEEAIESYALKQDLDMLLTADSFARMVWDDVFGMAVWKMFSSQEQSELALNETGKVFSALNKLLKDAVSYFPDDSAYLKTIGKDNDQRIEWLRLLKTKGVAAVRAAQEELPVD